MTSVIPTEVTLGEISAAPEGDVAEIPTRQPDNLPLNKLQPPVFERLVAELIRLQNASCHFYGRSGQLQHGLDIYEEREDGNIALYQVKRYQDVTAADLKEAVTDYAGPPVPRILTQKRVTSIPASLSS